jgi:arylsulfatase A-like enzyme
MNSDQPNIVLFLLDAARCRNFSCYGYHRETTPFIDQIAAGGSKYNYAFANSIFSLPSYASIFTGQYPTEHGAIDWSDRIEQNILVEGLNDAGYTTQAVSTHLVSDEFGVGDAFDRTESLFLEGKDLLYEDDPVSERFEDHAGQEGWESERQKYLLFLREFLAEPSYRSMANGAYKLYRRVRKSLGLWDDDGGRQALETAKSALSEVEEPFFLFLNFIETHDPYRPPRDYIREFLPDDASLSEVKVALDYVSTRATAGVDRITDRQRELLLALYDAEIRYVDDLIREFVDHLNERGLRENTVLVVLSDHGDAFGEHGLWGHQGRIYNETSHVPLVIDYPWRKPEVVTETTELRVLCDHLIGLANGNRDRMPAEGEALVEYYGWDTQLSYNPWEKFDDITFDEWGRYQAALIDDRLKLLVDASGRQELYDIEADYAESIDRSAEQPADVERLQSRIKQLVGDPVENDGEYRESLAAEGADHSSELTQHLKDLGYVE